MALSAGTVPPPNDVTHGDILLQIGELKGQVATLITLVGQKREDINNAFSRLAVVEKSCADRSDLVKVEARVSVLERDVAKWAGICIAVGVIMPLAVNAAKPYLHFGETRPTEVRFK